MDCGPQDWITTGLEGLFAYEGREMHGARCTTGSAREFKAKLSKARDRLSGSEPRDPQLD